MGRDWTIDQLNVIGHRGSSLLVSAAAGSGKTAVLVERILQMVTDPDHPVDIDRLLVVTFTKAAAGEMKSRLADALSERLAKDPDNEHLQRQSVLIHHAQITTIHSFCHYVIQNYFERIHIDPAFRIADEGELKLLQEEVMDSLLEREYAKAEMADPAGVDGGTGHTGDAGGWSGTDDAGDPGETGDAGDQRETGNAVGKGETGGAGEGAADLSETEKARQEGRAFRRFVRAYASGKNDRNVADLIFQVYTFSQSHPYPDDWLDQCLAIYRKGTSDTLTAELLKYAKLSVTGILAVARELQEKAAGRADLEGCAEVLASDCRELEKVLEEDTYDGIRDALGAVCFARWKSPRGAEPEVKGAADRLKKRRDSEVRKALERLRTRNFAHTEEQNAEDLKAVRPYMEELVRLVRAFAADYAAARRARNIADYSDLEHYALAILEEKDKEGRRVRTPAARELAARYVEIMTDEYQDSSFLQEAILYDVSGEADGRNNRFMVGDIKQSIYGFRMAQPSLFLDKMQAYAQDHSAGRRIDLGKNFRSRPEVLQTVNAFFERMMIPEIGGIRYDETQRLYAGQDTYPRLAEDAAAKSELLLIDRSREEFADYQNKEQRIALEARAVAARILTMVHGGTQISDKDTKNLRPLRFRDIVILLRTAQDWADIYVKTLQEAGIPAYTPTKSGYFAAPEVRLILDYLRILCNPEQDIPYTAVLRSPIAGLNDRELGEIRAFCPSGTYYYAVQTYLRAGRTNPAGRESVSTGDGSREDVPDPALFARLDAFDRQLQDMRERAVYTPVHTLIDDILRETGYGSYAAAMPGGQQREANLSMLSEKAAAYESTSYHGVFNFVRYIEKLEKYKIDDGEVNISSEDDDIVRVMTIHASKGLEFPVVFIGGLGKQFNRRDQAGAVIMHAELGIGLKRVDPDRRLKGETALRRIISDRKGDDMLGEEMRVLYVAMTRAEQKLILAGTVNGGAEVERFFSGQAEADQIRDLSKGGKKLRVLRYDELEGARGYLDWIRLAVPDSSLLAIREVTGEDLACVETVDNVNIQSAVEKLRAETEADASTEADAPTKADAPQQMEKIRAFFQRRDAFRYPYEEAADLPAKMTVTEIKKRSLDMTAEELGEKAWPEEGKESCVPRFMQENPDAEVAGAARGTIYHSFFEHLDYPGVDRLWQETGREGPGTDALEEQLREQIGDMTARGIFSGEEAACLRVSDFTAFLHTDLGKRMRAAACAGSLRREQPFVLDVPAGDIDKSWPAAENILVQGTIDAYFSERDADGDDVWILVDYKTDHVTTADGSDLREKYATQLRFYKKALEQITGKRVKEMWIYSVTLAQAIPVE